MEQRYANDRNETNQDEDKKTAPIGNIYILSKQQ